MSSRTEKELHFHCQQWLEQSGWWDRLLIFHVPNERRGGVGTGIHFKRMGVRPGIADYLMFGGTRDAAIELKTKDGKQNEHQIKFKLHWERIGKLYFTVRTVEDFQNTVIGLSLF